MHRLFPRCKIQRLARNVLSPINDAEHHFVDLSELRGLSVGQEPMETAPGQIQFSYREVDITTPDGQELANRHAVRAVPATIIDGRLTFVGVPSRESAEKALQLKMRPREV